MKRFQTAQGSTAGSEKESNQGGPGTGPRSGDFESPIVTMATSSSLPLGPLPASCSNPWHSSGLRRRAASGRPSLPPYLLAYYDLNVQGQGRG